MLLYTTVSSSGHMKVHPQTLMSGEKKQFFSCLSGISNDVDFSEFTVFFLYLSHIFGGNGQSVK